MKVVAIGDIHGRFDLLNEFINKRQPDIIIQCGDNAYYWGHDNEGKIKPQNTEVYMLPGNHENWDKFESEIGRNWKEPVEVEKNIFHCPIGSTLMLNDKKCLFVGGADSTDKSSRYIKLDWWPQEIVSFKDYQYIVRTVDRADIIFSHTCPNYFDMSEAEYQDKINDPSRVLLSMVYDSFKPTAWYFGHWHEYIEGQYMDTHGKGLNYIGQNTPWFKCLDIYKRG
jgi:Icc-related predicted phosphoesterase